MEAHKASGQGGSVDLKKEKFKIRTLILSGGTIRCDVPFDFCLNQSDLLQLVLTGSILFLVSSKLIFFFFAVLESNAFLRPCENALCCSLARWMSTFSAGSSSCCAVYCGDGKCEVFQRPAAFSDFIAEYTGRTLTIPV